LISDPPGTRQDNPKFGELPKLRLDLYPAAWLFHDDVVAHRKTKSGPSPAGLVVKKGIEYLLFYFGRYSGAIVTDADLDLVTKIPRRGVSVRSKPSSASACVRCRVKTR